jgi:hypothetical protein
MWYNKLDIKEKAALLYPRMNFGMIEIKNPLNDEYTIVCVGGLTNTQGHSVINSCEYYDYVDNRWVTMP